MMRSHRPLRSASVGIATAQIAQATARSMAEVAARPSLRPGGKLGSSRPLTWWRPGLNSAGDADGRQLCCSLPSEFRGGAAVYTMAVH
jgi:hypothetical protein